MSTETQATPEVPTDPAAVPAWVQQAVVGAENQQVVTAKFADMLKSLETMKAQAAKRVDEATAAAKAAQAELVNTQQQRTAADVDSALLERQIQVLLDSGLDKEVVDSYCLRDITTDVTKSDNPIAMRRGFDRILVACNAQLMAKRADVPRPAPVARTNTGPPPKRQAREPKSELEAALDAEYGETFEL